MRMPPPSRSWRHRWRRGWTSSGGSASPTPGRSPAATPSPADPPLSVTCGPDVPQGGKYDAHVTKEDGSGGARFGAVDDAQPRAVGLLADELDAAAGVVGRDGGGQGQV